MSGLITKLGIAMALAFDAIGRAFKPKRMTCKRCGVETEWHSDNVCTTCWWDGE